MSQIDKTSDNTRPSGGGRAGGEQPAGETTTPGGYWRSLNVLERGRASERERGAADAALDEFVAREFPTQVDQLMDPLSRRRFMQLMGASLAFAGAAGAGCRRWEREEIVPLATGTQGRVPGVPEHYASAMELGGVAVGLLVKAYEGRPVKIEGNPEHPFTGRASSTFAQASVLELYDPDRSREVTLRNFLHFEDGVYYGGKHYASSWEAFEAFARQLSRGARLRVLSEATSSASVALMREALASRFDNFKWHEWEPLSLDNERAGTALAFGQPLRPIAALDRAKVICALDGDILVDHPAALRYARDFAAGRRPQPGQGASAMNRLYAVESTMSHTGAVADHRLPLRSEHALPFALALEARLTGGAAPRAAFLAEPKVEAFLAALAEDLQKNTGRAVVLAGHRQPKEAHAVVARINARLSAVGSTVTYVREGDDETPERAPHVQSIAELVADMQAGSVDTLLILGGNPVYDAPADLKFADALRRVRDSVHLSAFHDETSAECSWHLPRAHFLEAWGDARAWDGTLTVAQPLVEPLHGGRSAVEVLALLAGDTRPASKIVRDAVAAATGIVDDAGWRVLLHDGFAPGTAYEAVRPTVQWTASPALDARHTAGMQADGGGLEVVFTRSSHSYDGRFANNGWLQETPDFATKLTWDNAALIAPATARALGIANGAMIKIKLADRELKVPAYVMPGQAPFSVAVALGHGRTRAGHVGGLADDDVAPVGFDAYAIRVSTAPYIAGDAVVAPAGGSHPLATTQDHWQIDARGQREIEKRLDAKKGRFKDGLIRQVDVEEYTPGFKYTPHGPPLVSLFDRHPTLSAETADADPGQDKRVAEFRWGMATDLSTCIGCNACMVACQAENNVPIVGKRQVMRTREMHWIRIDRYFRGDPDDPEVALQPVTCQQCENAPCEQVCPVGATLHTDEGLNDMAYNRCVGTRYCLNNCPYRVRRFNFLDYHKNNEGERNKIRSLLFNPDVTVRSRGVMEKCTFCVQRIEQVKIQLKNERVRTGERVPLPDGAIQTACMQACPTDAIVFGDLRDPNSRVSKLHAESRQYSLLAELNTLNRNVYLARVRNPNPALGGSSHGGETH